MKVRIFRFVSIIALALVTTSIGYWAGYTDGVDDTADHFYALMYE